MGNARHGRGGGARAVSTGPSWVLARLALLPGLLVVLAATGCARPDNWVQTYPDIAARARRDPQSVFAEMYARWDDLHGMVGSYQVRARRGLSSRTIDTQIYLLRDAFVEIQVIAPTFTSEGYLGVGTKEVGLWIAGDPCLYRGPNEPGAFGRALGIPLTPANIVATLMGYAVPLGGNATATWDQRARRIRVTAEGVTAWLHPVSGRFERVLVNTSSGPIDIEYREWSGNNPPVPVRMDIDVAAEGITLQLRLAPAWIANPEGLDRAFFDDMYVAGAVDCPLEQLALEGGLLRRGLGR